MASVMREMSSWVKFFD